jgi:hypothetical protein
MSYDVKSDVACDDKLFNNLYNYLRRGGLIRIILYEIATSIVLPFILLALQMVIVFGYTEVIN